MPNIGGIAYRNTQRLTSSTASAAHYGFFHLSNIYAYYVKLTSANVFMIDDAKVAKTMVGTTVVGLASSVVYFDG